ncbi:MAG: hypothetical protein V1882_05345 [Candidatus Omnitrophota bacterium]
MEKLMIEILEKFQGAFLVLLSSLLSFLFALWAFNHQEARREGKNEKDVLKNFLSEIKLNEIRCGMMVDSESFNLFDIDVLNRFKNSAQFLSKAIAKYVIFIGLVNNSVADFLDFERFYTGDAKNGTQENEKASNSKRIRLLESLKSFQETLAMAKADVAAILEKGKMGK